MKKYELTADMTENRQYGENDGEDWPTKKWRWSLKVRNTKHAMTVNMIITNIAQLLLNIECKLSTMVYSTKFIHMTCTWVMPGTLE